MSPRPSYGTLETRVLTPVPHQQRKRPASNEPAGTQKPPGACIRSRQAFGLSMAPFLLAPAGDAQAFHASFFSFSVILRYFGVQDV